MPLTEPARAIRWLAMEPVRYEHHRFSFAMRYRLPFLCLPLVVFPAFLSRSLHHPLPLLVSLPLLALVLSHFGWSEVLLTHRRLVLEGRVFDLEGLRRVVLVRPWGHVLPTHFDVELHYDSGDRLDARIKHVTPDLRTALHQLGFETGSDWGPW